MQEQKEPKAKNQREESSMGGQADGTPADPAVVEMSTPPGGAEAAPATEGGLGPAELAAAYQKVLAEKQELFERLLRKQAELENFRKRTQREKEEFLQHANADLLRALLPALDGLERALKHRDAKVPNQFYEGLEHIHRQFLDILGRAGLAPIETSGKTFDPHLHQAVEMVESEEHGDHEIVEELQRGYKLKNRLLRPAIVKVAVAPKGGDSENQN